MGSDIWGREPLPIQHKEARLEKLTCFISEKNRFCDKYLFAKVNL